jgi:hypothetical protein
VGGTLAAWRVIYVPAAPAIFRFAPPLALDLAIACAAGMAASLDRGWKWRAPRLTCVNRRRRRLASVLRMTHVPAHPTRSGIRFIDEGRVLARRAAATSSSMSAPAARWRRIQPDLEILRPLRVSDRP